MRAFELVRPKRDPVRVEELRAIYQELDMDRCLYTNRKLGERWDMDHILPFSRFPVNYFWNLVPATVAANRGKGGKFDRIPRLTGPLLNRYTEFLRKSLSQGSIIVARDVDATYRQHFGQPAPEEWYGDRTVRTIRATLEMSWARLEAAGVEIWEPN